MLNSRILFGAMFAMATLLLASPHSANGQSDKSTTPPDQTQTPDLTQPEVPQDDPGATDPQPQAAQSSADSVARFKQLIQERINNTAQIDKLYATMPIGFAAKQKEYTRGIEALKQRNIAIVHEMKDAAIEAFKVDGGQNPQITNFVLQMTQRYLTGKDYMLFEFQPDVALKLVELIESKNLELGGIEMYAYRANYLVENYEKAKEYLQAAKQKGMNFDEQKAFEDLDLAISDWQRELEFRAQDEGNDLPRVKFETDAGEIVIELFEDQAPNTVANFISLVEAGFYNGQMFHLVNPVLTAASGCPFNNGTGGPGYEIKCECYDREFRKHFRGVISMAHGGRDTGGSRFFISKQRIPAYDGKFTVFGRIIEGLNLVYGLKVVDNTAVVQKDAKPASKIERVTVIRKRDHEYKPEKVVRVPNLDDGVPGIIDNGALTPGIDK